jgi:hypothetical protein
MTKGNRGAESPRRQARVILQRSEVAIAQLPRESFLGTPGRPVDGAVVVAPFASLVVAPEKDTDEPTASASRDDLA